MKTLDEHNAENIRTRDKLFNGAGVSCPNHPDTEMEFLHGSQVINTSYPGSQTVKCPRCGYIGYKQLPY